MSPQPFFRASRAVLFATVVVALATLGHGLASSHAVPVWAVLAGFAGTLGVTWALAGHERSLATIFGGLLGGQFALHTLYANASLGSGHHGGSLMPGRDSGWTMTFAHVVAAALAAWWLRRGERALWSLARRLTFRPAPPLVVEPPAPPARIPVVPVADVPVPVARALRHQVVRRGPPLRSRAL
ncbi:MFS transporter [Actinomadura kijaniata]|uniref:MFS transporter n=1 Tax=Actinomadura kijaniata TaxID=46161 RepID=UPI003F1A2A45